MSSFKRVKKLIENASTGLQKGQRVDEVSPLVALLGAGLRRKGAQVLAKWGPRLMKGLRVGGKVGSGALTAADLGLKGARVAAGLGTSAAQGVGKVFSGGDSSKEEKEEKPKGPKFTHVKSRLQGNVR